MGLEILKINLMSPQSLESKPKKGQKSTEFFIKRSLKRPNISILVYRLKDRNVANPSPLLSWKAENLYEEQKNNLD